MRKRLAHLNRLMALTSVALLVLGTQSCKREERDFRVQPPQAVTNDNLTAVTSFHAGPGTEPSHVANEYEQNAYALSQGQIIYNNFNCVGCHFHGGGGIGPPLMDSTWIYGSAPDQIYATIIQGRPNGMPSFKGRLTDNQVWQVVAYVRSLSGLANPQAASGRSDDMQAQPPPNSMPKPATTQSFTPPGTQMPS
jgi:cytochrome c oxidase cbb3-type subunit 3